MSKRDGVETIDKKPTVVLVIFGDIDDDIAYYILKYLKNFVLSFEAELEFTPSFPLLYKSDPRIDSLEEREGIFANELDSIEGDIVLGVTNVGIWSVSPHPRFIFGFGSDAQGLISLCRFRKETENKNLMKERIGKEVIKILARACHVGDCHEKDCILIYHWNVEDFDQNRYVCQGSRKEFANAFKRIFTRTLKSE